MGVFPGAVNTRATLGALSLLLTRTWCPCSCCGSSKFEFKVVQFCTHRTIFKFYTIIITMFIVILTYLFFLCIVYNNNSSAYSTLLYVYLELYST